MGDFPGPAARRALDTETEMLALPAAAPDKDVAGLAALVDQAEAYLRQARAENTLRAYASDWKDFERWFAARQVSVCPAAPATVALYLTALAANHKVSTLTRRLSAISQAHRTAGVPTPAEEAGVRGLMACIRRSRGTVPTARRPLLVPELQALLAALPENLLGFRDRAPLLLGFSGAFRRSELVSLNGEDVLETCDGLVLTLRRSCQDALISSKWGHSILTFS